MIRGTERIVERLRYLADLHAALEAWLAKSNSGAWPVSYADDYRRIAVAALGLFGMYDRHAEATARKRAGSGDEVTRR